MNTLPGLKGRTILITRPEPEADNTADLVRGLGGTPFLAPALRILPPNDSGPLRHAMNSLGSYGGVIITSLNGARAFVRHLPGQSEHPPLFAVGPKTAGYLAEAGFKALTAPPPYNAEALAGVIRNGAVEQKPFLFLRGETGKETIITELAAAGFDVELVTAYRAQPITEVSTPVLAALAEGRIDAVAFFSSRTAEAFIGALPDHARNHLHRVIIACISEQTAETVAGLGYPVQVTPMHAAAEAVMMALASYWN